MKFNISPSDSTHPAVRFLAPSAIQAGVPLKNLFDGNLVTLIGESFGNVLPTFNQHRFEKTATAGLDELELSQRARHIGLSIADQLPKQFAKACPIILASFGPELQKTVGNGLAPFFYWPHSYAIAESGIGDFENGMFANYELTKRFTAEFSIRPFLNRYPDECLPRLIQWASDPNPHVRRLVTEGTRPRLPWGMRLQGVLKETHWTLPLLELLKDDAELYVRRSVANHLGDILKDHPDTGFEVCDRWLREIREKRFPSEQADCRRWMIRHAVRHPAKQGDSRAVRIRAAAARLR